MTRKSKATPKGDPVVSSYASLDPKAGDVVLHYKGDLYIVLATGFDEETCEPVVIYTALAPPRDGRRSKACIWVRTVAAWRKHAKPVGERSRPRYVDVVVNNHKPGGFRVTVGSIVAGVRHA